MTTRLRIFSPSFADFLKWRVELGKSQQEIADVAGVSLEQYIAAEQDKAASGETYAKIVVAFKKFGKEGLSVSGHSTLQ